MKTGTKFMHAGCSLMGCGCGLLMLFAIMFVGVGCFAGTAKAANPPQANCPPVANVAMVRVQSPPVANINSGVVTRQSINESSKGVTPAISESRVDSRQVSPCGYYELHTYRNGNSTYYRWEPKGGNSQVATPFAVPSHGLQSVTMTPTTHAINVGQVNTTSQAIIPMVRTITGVRGVATYGVTNCTSYG